jgi:sporadic carbohydrate cluster 2OG-Fe(II) oxygenase
MINNNIEKFDSCGYVVLKLTNTDSLTKFKNKLLLKVQDILDNKNITLENIHQYIKSEQEKIDIQYTINKMVWEDADYKNIILENIDLFYRLIGRDLDIQTQPYVRVARPHCPEDNIGYHRDSFYGNSVYEISVWIPLVNIDEKSALNISESSHLLGKIPYTKVTSEEVEKGDRKNSLGFQYAPKIIDKSFSFSKRPIPLNESEILVFSLGLLHGQEVNEAEITRWSIDIRLKNSFTPTQTKDGYYTNLVKSPVSKAAELYTNAMNKI